MSYCRTAWLIYLLDALASLETTEAPLILPRDVKHLPIPAPESVWGAKSAEDWARLRSRSEGAPLQLDFILEKLFDFETEQVNQKTVSPSLIDVVELGPFARLIMIITVVKGMIEYGEGKPRGGYVVRRWILGGKDGWCVFSSNGNWVSNSSVRISSSSRFFSTGTMGIWSRIEASNFSSTSS